MFQSNWNNCSYHLLDRILSRLHHRNYHIEIIVCKMNSLLFLIPSERRLCQLYISKQEKCFMKCSLQNIRTILCFILKVFLTQPQVSKQNFRNMPSIHNQQATLLFTQYILESSNPDIICTLPEVTATDLNILCHKNS